MMKKQEIRSFRFQRMNFGKADDTRKIADNGDNKERPPRESRGLQ